MDKFWLRAMVEQLIPVGLIDLVLWALYIGYGGGFFLGMAIVFFLIVIFTIWFFRNPDRVITDSPRALLAPADGKIVAITQENDPHFFGGQVTRISIFLSVFDVHINRIPMAGEVIFSKYNRGKFINAFSEKASLDNEQNMIAIRTHCGDVMIKQIAGWIARRIICQVQPGDRVSQGEIYGMIKFGSRTDILVQADMDIKVHVGQRVRGGISVLSEFK